MHHSALEGRISELIAQFEMFMAEKCWSSDEHHVLNTENAALNFSWHTRSGKKDILTFLMWYERIWISSCEIQWTYVFYVTLLWDSWSWKWAVTINTISPFFFICVEHSHPCSCAFRPIGMKIYLPHLHSIGALKGMLRLTETLVAGLLLC